MCDDKKDPRGVQRDREGSERPRGGGGWVASVGRGTGAEDSVDLMRNLELCVFGSYWA